MTAITDLAEWAAGVSGRHGTPAYGRARLAVQDTLACVLAGAGDEAARRARAAVAGWGGRGATVIATPERLAAPWAALVNGAAAHALDFDDHEETGATHPSAVLVPALLALGEERRASGRALLDAYIVGLEVIMRVGEAVNMSHYHRGWHATGTLGALGAAAACARLMGLDVEETTAALGLATSLAGGFKSQFGTMAKPLHAGLAAKSGVLAASLAAAGLSASAAALDGPWSVLTLMAGPEAAGFAGPLDKLGRTLAIEEFGLSVKLYPCCGYIHRSVDGLLDLRAAHGLSGAEVEAVTTRIPGRDAENLMYPDPGSPTEARFSMQYCLAVALLTGGLGVADFRPAAIARPEVRAVLPKVRLEGHPIGPQSSGPGVFEPAEVVLRLADGRVLEQVVHHARGAPELPVGEAEIGAKFRACAEGVLEPAEATAAGSLIAAFEDLAEVNALTRHLAAPLLDATSAKELRTGS
jgi:2-methylcitrate dehydratase PrpD